MILIKKLKRPNRKSGARLDPGEVAEHKAFGVTITNTGKVAVYVDRYTPKRRRKRK